MSVLSVSGIRKRFGATISLDGVDFDLDRGEVMAVIGENGAGKSTLMNIIAGLMKPDSGQIFFNGRSVSYIHQELSLFPHLTVAENVFVGLEPLRFGLLDRRRMNVRTQELLESFNRPEIRPDITVANLSSASRQVVEICRALASNADLILMDEPTSSLQQSDTERLFKIIRNLSARGVSVIYVSHFLEEVRRVAQRAVVLRNGQSV